MTNLANDAGFRHLAGQVVSRRTLLRFGLAVAGLTATSSLLTACGGDTDDDNDPAATESDTAASPASAPTPEGSEAEETEDPDDEGSPEATQQGSSSNDPLSVNPRHFGFDIEPAASEGGTLIEATVTEIEGGVGLAVWSAWGIVETLVELNPYDGTYVGNLAESWETSEDATTWTLALRPDVTWHDGKPLSANDVVSALQIWASVPEGWYAFNEETTFEAADDMTVQITLPEPSVFVLEALEFTPIFANHAIEEVTQEHLNSYLYSHPMSTGSDPAQVIGTGPFKFKEKVDGSHVGVVRNDDYWDGKPHLDEYIVRFVPDEDQLSVQMTTNEIDFTGVNNSLGLSPASIGTLDSDNIVSVDEPNPVYISFLMNHRTEFTTLFQDVQVRRALVHALDREALVETVLFGYGNVAHGPVSEIYGVEQELIEPKYEYDPDLAAQLLDEAGWTVGSDGVREKDGQKMAFKLYGIAGDATQEQLAVAMQEFWRVIGVEATVELEQRPVWRERRNETHDFETLIHFLSGSISDQTGHYYCGDGGEGGASPNRPGYCNHDVDAIVDQFAVETDTERFQELVLEYQNALAEDCPVGFLAFQRFVGAHSTRAHNLHLNPVNGWFNMETWWVEA